jgi:tetraacyldisaccharide 4'-kinase
MRGLLRCAETPYTLAMNWRNRRYDSCRIEVLRVSVPVVSVGNLTLGGTGKTPMVKWLARWMLERGRRPAIVSRGYGAESGRHNDEALELASAQSGLVDVPHVQNRNRVVAAQRAIDEFRCDAIILDDGFQHRRLARDVEIVLLDALEPFGYEHVFPRGTLREPASGLRRAHIVCLSRADVATVPQRDAIRRRAQEMAPAAAWCELTHAPSRLVSATGELKPVEHLSGKRVAAFCGIGNPAGFRHTLRKAGCEVVAWREFPDHHAYTPSDISMVRGEATAARADMMVCTHKDLVKFPTQDVYAMPLWAVTIEIQFLSGQEELEAKVADVLRSV